MTLQELEVAIGDLIKQIYCKEYVGKMKLVELLTYSGGHLGYKLTLGLNNVDKPLIISYEGTETQFLGYLEKELRSRHLETVIF